MKKYIFCIILMQQKNLLISFVPVYSMYKCKYNQTGLKKLCMYVYSCKSGQMYKINFYLSCDYLLHEKCMGNPVHLCIWQKKNVLPSQIRCSSQHDSIPFLDITSVA